MKGLVQSHTATWEKNLLSTCLKPTHPLGDMAEIGNPVCATNELVREMRLCASCCYRDLEGTGKVNRKYLFNCFNDLRAVFVQEKKNQGVHFCVCCLFL